MLLVPVAFFAGCGPAPTEGGTGGGSTGGGSTGGGYQGPKIIVAVKLLANATNLHESIVGADNDVYIVGNLDGLKLASDT
ncbi:MAG: hypothetical protein ACP5PT_05440, partial [Brevinematia bacterium]